MGAGMTCKQCKHWARSRDGYGNVIEDDANDGYLGRHRLCEQITLRDPHPVLLGEDPPLAYTQDASGYQADVWTSPDFSCALFERIAK